VESGKITAIIGESGSGKSVACYSMLGLVPMPPGRIDGGRAIFEGRDLLEMSEAQLRADARRRHRHDLPGPDDLPESLPAHRRAD
jgi:ABC-type dipeptide/oligopeptide/nickel transport system ATPase component